MPGEASPLPVPGRRLTLLGALAMLAGAGAIALGAVYLVLPFAGKLLAARGAPPVSPRAAVSGALTWLLVGGAAIAAGWGSIQRRPWARPAMLSLAWAALLGGAFVFALTALTFDVLVARGSGLPAEAAAAAKLFVLGILGLGGIVFPAIFVWAYSGRAVEACFRGRGTDPLRPPALVGLALGLGSLAVLSLPLALQPVVPFFGRVVSGGPGALLTLAGGAVGAGLAYAVLRRSVGGLWATAAYLGLIGVSFAVTVQRAGLHEMLRASGYPEAQLEGFPRSADALAFWGAWIVTAASLLYVVRVARHVRRLAR